MFQLISNTHQRISYQYYVNYLCCDNSAQHTENFAKHDISDYANPKYSDVIPD